MKPVIVCIDSPGFNDRFGVLPAMISTIVVSPIARENASTTLATIPVGSYPHGMRISPDGSTLAAARGDGYLVVSATRTGEPLAMIDGRMLTLRRTACASALAAKYLARSDASRLLMIGTGALAPHLIRAHAAVRPIRTLSPLSAMSWKKAADEVLQL